MPSLSVVAAITLPDGLINTTVTFERPTLFASTMRPVTFTVVRKRAEAFLSASSEIDFGGGAGSDFVVSGFEVSGAGSGVVVGCGAGVVVSGVVVAGVEVLTAAPVAAASFSSRPSSEPLMRL